jgi:hypothetical protein
MTYDPRYADATAVQQRVADAYPIEEVSEMFRSGNALTECGDSLFTFLVREAGEADDLSDCVRMFDRAIDDIQTVTGALNR